MTLVLANSHALLDCIAQVSTLIASAVRHRARRTLSILISAAAISVAITIAIRSNNVSFAIGPLQIAAGFLFLIGNTVFAGIRLTAVARQYGYKLPLNDALRANAAGAALAQIMISYLGHATGRIATLRRSGISANDLIEIGLIERLAALATLTLISIVAAVKLFGGIALPNPLHMEWALYMAVGLVLSFIITVGVVYRPMIARYLAGGDAKKAASALIVATAWSLVAHLFMLAAFSIFLSSVVELNTSVVAACVLVLFAAAIPISFGGWGVRELSAVAALTQVGIEASTAVQAAIAIGLGSLLSHIAFWVGTSPVRNVVSTMNAASNHTEWKQGGLLVAIPALISILIAFSVHVPTQGGPLNVDLADPFAIVSLALFAAYWVNRRQLPQWTLPYVNHALVAITALFCISAAVGYLHFGYSSWGLRNRLLGWVVLLGYVGAGSMIVYALDNSGRRMLLAGLIVSLSVISCLEYARLLAVQSALTAPWSSQAGEGFAQNVNAQAVLLITAIAGALTMRRKRLSLALLVILLIGLYITQSRSGVGAGLGVLMVAAIMRPTLLARIVPAIGIALTVAALPLLYSGSADFVSGSWAVVSPMRSAAQFSTSDTERMKSITEGLELWFNHPLFGAGLGAYFEQTMAEGTPLVIHSTPVWLLAETGLVGFAGFAVIVVFIAWKWIVLAWKGDNVALTGLLILTGIGAMSLVHELMFQRIIWLSVGALIARTSAPIAAEISAPDPYGGTQLSTENQAS